MADRSTTFNSAFIAPKWNITDNINITSHVHLTNVVKVAITMMGINQSYADR